MTWVNYKIQRLLVFASVFSVAILTFNNCDKEGNLTGQVVSGVDSSSNNPSNPPPPNPPPKTISYILDYNFSQKTVTGQVQDQSNSTLLSFSRADGGQSLARYSEDLTFKKASPGAARFPSNSSGVLGIQIEDESTNLLSQDLTRWFIGQKTTVTPNAALGPDGLMSATRAVYQATETEAYVASAIVSTAGVNNIVTGSVYLRGNAPGQVATIWLFNTSAPPKTVTLDSTKYTRVVLTGTVTQSNVYLLIENDSGIGNNIDLDLNFWGAQVEVGYTATTPVDGLLTRPRDELKITDLSWLDLQQGVFVVSTTLPPVTNPNNQMLLSLSTGVGVVPRPADGLYIGGIGGKTAVEIISGGVSKFSLGQGPNWEPNKDIKLAIRYDGTSVTVYENGVLAATVNGTLPAGLNLLNLGYSGGYYNKAYFNGVIKSFKYSKDVVTDQELKQLSVF